MSETPAFVFQPPRPRLSDPLRSRPTVMVVSDNATTSDDAYLYASDPSVSMDAQGDAAAVASRELLRYAALKFFTTSLGTPFELANTLTQVQFLPNDATVERMRAEADSDDDIAERMEEEVREEKEKSEDEFDSDDPEYYDPTRMPGQGKQRATTTTPHAAGVIKKRKTQVSGYLDIHEIHGEQPEYQLAAESRSSWATFVALYSSNHEGLFALWKGQTAYWAHEMLQLFLQPSLEAFLNDRFGLYDDTIPLQHLDRVGPNLITMIGSNLAVGMLLSPMETVRTRMMVQSLSPRHRRYATPIHAFSDLVSVEHRGSWKSVYVDSPLIVPNLLYHTLHPIFDHCAPVFIERFLGISHTDSPIKYAFFEFCWNNTKTMMLMPIDTVRKRLQLQVQSPGKPLDTVVSVRQGYAGFTDCIVRMITEEGGRRTVSGKVKKPTRKGVADMWWWQRLGVQALYRGFVMQVVTNGALSLASLFNLQAQSDW